MHITIMADGQTQEVKERLIEYQLKKIEDYLPHSRLKDELPYVISLLIRVNNETDASALKSELDILLGKYNS